MKKYLFVLLPLSTVVIFTNFDQTAPVFQTKKTLILNDSLEKDRQKYIDEVTILIKGKEGLPVDSVFKNLKYLSGFDAEILPIAMKRWSIALGVSCGHCHENSKWDLDTKPEKAIALQMAEMSSKINQDLLKNIKGLKNNKPVINCATCPQGHLKPPLSVKGN